MGDTASNRSFERAASVKTDRFRRGNMKVAEDFTHDLLERARNDSTLLDMLIKELSRFVFWVAQASWDPRIY